MGDKQECYVCGTIPPDWSKAYQHADDDAEADLGVGHEGEKAVDGQAAQHPDPVDVVEVDFAAQQKQWTEGKTESLQD